MTTTPPELAPAAFDVGARSGFTQSVSGDATRLELLRATLKHAATHARHYRQAFAGLNLNAQSFEDLQRLPLLDRDTLARHGTELLIDGAVPEYIGITSGTSFGDSSREPLLHYQVESEHQAWIKAHSFMAENAQWERPLMLRLTDPDRGVEIAGAFPGCFSVPLENSYHFQLILSILRREWSFPGFSKRVVSLSGPLDALQLLTLVSMEQGVDPQQFGIGVLSSSGWQMTTRWRGLLERYWNAEVQDVYGLSEAPGMFAIRCRSCSRFHFSPLSVIEILGLDHDRPVTSGIGRVVVTCLLPLAQAQPLIRYDTGEVIEIWGECKFHPVGFEYVGRRTKVIFVEGADGLQPVLSPLTITEILDSIPSVALEDNPKARPLGLMNTFGWPRYRVHYQKHPSGQRQLDLTVELRWPPQHYPEAAENLRMLVLKNLFAASPALSTAVNRGDLRFHIDLVGPGAIVRTA